MRHRNQLAGCVMVGLILCCTHTLVAQECSLSDEGMFTHDEDHAESCDDLHHIIQPAPDPTDSATYLVVDALGGWVPGSPPPVGGGPNVITINTHSMVGSPTTGLISAADAFAFANSDGVATRIEFDPTVFNATSEPLLTDGPLQLLSDFDEIDGAGALVILQPSATSSDDRFGIGVVARDTTVRNITLDGFSVTGVVAAGAFAAPTIENVTVMNSGQHGMLVLDGADAAIEGCTFVASGDDAVRVDNASATVSGCTIDGSGEHGLAALNSYLRLEGSTMTNIAGWGLLFTGDAPGILSLPSAHVSSDCINDIFAGNVFDPGGQTNWFVHPQAQTIFDDLLAPDFDFPDSLDVSQPVAMYLPFTTGAEVKVGQGYNNPNTHACSLGLDLNLWNGVNETFVRACARGRVVRTLNWIAGPAASKSGNTVVIDHGFGILSSYTHLQQNSITVQPGQIVDRYDVIGIGSSTGNSGGPHLHLGFVKYRSRRVWPEQFPDPTDHSCDSPLAFDIRFADIPGSGFPYQNQRDDDDNCVTEVHPDPDNDSCVPYTSGNGPDLNPPPFEDSHMARDLFIDRNSNYIENDYQNGDGVIQLTRKVPLAYYHAEEEYVFRGLAPVGATVISLAIKDYVSGDIIETIEGLVDGDGRFSIAKTFCDPGAYRITLDAAHQLNEEDWEFYYRSSDFYSIIVVDESGTTHTPPYYSTRVLCDPDRDYDCDGTTNADDQDDDGDGVPDANDSWRDIVVNTLGDSDCSIGKWNITSALKSANTDCMRTRIRFDPVLFPPNNPNTIFFDRDIRTGNHGDLLTGVGAGVIFAATDEETSRALTMIGAQGMTVRNIRFENFVGGTVSVSWGTKAWFNGCDMYQGANGTSYPLKCGDTSIVNFKNGEIYGNLDYHTVSLGEDARLTMSNASINTGYNGIRAKKDSVFTLCNVDFENFIDNAIRMDDTGYCKANNIHVFFSHDGVDLNGDSALQLSNSSMSHVDRGMVVRDTSALHVCDTVSSLNIEEYTLDSNSVTNWSDMPIYVGDDASIVGGACSIAQCEPNLNIGPIGDLKIAQPKTFKLTPP